MKIHLAMYSEAINGKQILSLYQTQNIICLLKLKKAKMLKL